MDTLGARAKAARDHLALSRHDVIGRMGLSRYATLVEIEENRVEPGAGRAAALAQALGVDCAWLITGDNSRAPRWSRPRTRARRAA